ncbi:MAG: hypothetical protein A4E58_00833 [Syntrophorhabdus sp. PtaB.Bin006]|nr:MAG: hypothetical protein A4E58_00833 [Syntrophorhabdus sp. PtaB.Bin006]
MAMAPSVSRLSGLVILRLKISDVPITAKAAITAMMVITLRLCAALWRMRSLVILFASTIVCP